MKDVYAIVYHYSNYEYKENISIHCIVENEKKAQELCRELNKDVIGVSILDNGFELDEIFDDDYEYYSIEKTNLIQEESL